MISDIIQIMPIDSQSFLLGDLWCEVVFQLSCVVVELELHHQRGLIRHVQGHLVRQAGGLREEVQVPRGKAQGDWLVHLEGHSGVVVAGLALVQDCVSSADFTSDGELDALFVGLNLDGLGKASELPADPVELVGWHRADRAELSLRNAKTLRIEVHEGKVELRDLLST